jgi:hypothetical protein
MHREQAGLDNKLNDWRKRKAKAEGGSSSSGDRGGSSGGDSSRGGGGGGLSSAGSSGGGGGGGGGGGALFGTAMVVGAIATAVAFPVPCAFVAGAFMFLKK